MYSEHLIASLQNLVQASYYSGADLDIRMSRPVVTVGRILGPDIGCQPTDAGLAWFAQRFGSPVPVGTRGAVHVLDSRRVGFGLGPGRGVIETGGDHLALVQNITSGRYSGAYRLPNVEYGGLV